MAAQVLLFLEFLPIVAIDGSSIGTYVCEVRPERVSESHDPALTLTISQATLL